MTEAVRIQTGRNMEWLDAGEMRLNQKLGGWANYFNLGPVTPAYRFIDRYTTTRLRRWLCKKHKQPSGFANTCLSAAIANDLALWSRRAGFFSSSFPP
jgi:hypothetical protein